MNTWRQGVLALSLVLAMGACGGGDGGEADTPPGDTAGGDAAGLDAAGIDTAGTDTAGSDTGGGLDCAGVPAPTRKGTMKSYQCDAVTRAATDLPGMYLCDVLGRGIRGDGTIDLETPSTEEPVVGWFFGFCKAGQPIQYVAYKAPPEADFPVIWTVPSAISMPFDDFAAAPDSDEAWGVVAARSGCGTDGTGAGTEFIKYRHNDEKGGDTVQINAGGVSWLATFSATGVVTNEADTNCGP